MESVLTIKGSGNNKCPFSPFIRNKQSREGTKEKKEEREEQVRIKSG